MRHAVVEDDRPQETNWKLAAVRYIAVPDLLDAAVQGLSESDLDVARTDGAWTIRQIVHHIVDADDVTNMIIKAALGSSGAVYRLDWYDSNNVWAETLDYASRSIAPATMHLWAWHRYVDQLLTHVPDAWERYVMLKRTPESEATRVTVGYLVQAQTHHAMHHIDQIRTTRKVHGL